MVSVSFSSGVRTAFESLDTFFTPFSYSLVSSTIFAWRLNTSIFAHHLYSTVFDNFQRDFSRLFMHNRFWMRLLRVRLLVVFSFFLNNACSIFANSLQCIRNVSSPVLFFYPFCAAGCDVSKEGFNTAGASVFSDAEPEEAGVLLRNPKSDISSASFSIFTISASTVAALQW